jgi:electron transfer flavoprotein alpha subunit
VEPVTASAAASLSQFVDEELSVSERPDFTSARVVISGGRGMISGEHCQILERIADKLGATDGASHAAINAGYVPNDT